MKDGIEMQFPPPSDNKQELELGAVFSPRFGEDGLLTAIVTDFQTSDLLMVAHMNAEALSKTLETGQAWFFSRSRQQLWLKGESSGNLLNIKEIKTDCDQDALWLKVQVAGSGAACHTGEISCFYRTLRQTEDQIILEAD